MIPELWGGTLLPEGGLSSDLSSPGELLARAALVAVLALVPLVLFLAHGVRRCRFWCTLQDREVEVELEENGPPGLRQAVGVRSCSAFAPPTAVACERRCLDVAFRRPWAVTVTRAER